jgi:hypothetical protein
MQKSPPTYRKKTETGPVSVRQAAAEGRRKASPVRAPLPDTVASIPTAPGEEAFGDRFPLTDQQRATASRDISKLKGTLQELATLMKASFGQNSQVAVRAEECYAALQRFEWELERTAPDSPTVVAPNESNDS